MADRYWVGGSGAWSAANTANWSDTSGGAGGASVPTSADNVFFDQAGPYTVTITGSVSCLNLSATPPGTNFTGASSGVLSVFGSFSWTGGGSSWNPAATLTFAGTTTGNTFTAVNQIGPVRFTGVGGGWTFGSAITFNLNLTTQFTAGTVNFGGYTVSFPGSGQLATVNGGTVQLSSSTVTFLSSTTGLTVSSGSVDFGSSTCTFQGSNPITRSGGTITIATSTINFNFVTFTFPTFTTSWYNVGFTNASSTSVTFGQSNTFNNVTFAGRSSAGIASVILSANQTINGTLTLSAGSNATCRTFVRSDTLGTTRTLTCAAVSATDIDFRDVTIAGAAAPASGTRLGDCKGNSGITFPAGINKYWTFSTGGNWSATAWTSAFSSNTPFWPAGFWSVQFTTAGSRLRQSSATLSLSGSDFTIEGWVYLTGYSPSYSGFFNSALCGTANDGVSNGYQLTVTGTESSYTGINFFARSGTVAQIDITGSQSLALNTWYHIAVTKSGTTYRLFINGTVVNTTTSSATWTDTGVLDVGQSGYPSFQYTMQGNISNFRLVKGTALYTSNFTPSTTPLTAVTNTSLLTCQNSRFVDNSANNLIITPAGAPTVSVLDPFPDPVGNYSASVPFNGSSGYISAPANAAFDFGSGDWTAECWVNTTSLAATSRVMGQTDSFGSGSFTSFLIEIATSGAVTVYVPTGPGSFATATGPANITANIWNHIAAVRNGNSVRVYVNGAQGSALSYSLSLPSTGQPFVVGRNGSNNGFYFPGLVSNVRIVKGTAVYTSSFTPPTSPLTAISGTSLLIAGTNPLSDSSSNNFTITVIGGAAVNDFPLAQDTAIFQASTVTLPSAATVTVNANYNIGTINMSARTSNTMTLATGTQTPAIYGNWINGTGTTLTGSGILTFAGRGSQTITSAGRTFTQRVTIDSPGGSLSLLDALNTSLGSSSAINHVSGTFDAASYNVTMSAASGGFASQGSAIRTLTLGSGTWTLSGTGGWNISGANLTVTGTGTISLTSASAKTFAGGGIQTYPTINQGGTGTLTVSGSNKFANITNTAIGSVLFTGGTTNDFDNFNLNGTSTAVRLTLGSTNTTQAILRKPTAWNVGTGSLDNGNNTGLSFIAGGGIDYLSVSYINGQVGGGGTTYNSSLFETASGSDAIFSVAVFLSSLSETATATDNTNAPGSTYNPSLSETATATDTLTGGLLLLSQVAEALTTADTVLGGLFLSSNILESGTATDAVDSTGTFNSAASETATAADDTATANNTFNPATVESATATDTSSTTADIGGAISETATATDSSQSTVAALSAIFETASIVDSISSSFAFFGIILENATATDATSTGNNTFNPTTVETATATDTAATGNNTFNPTTSESAAITDAVTPAGSVFNPSTAESASATDATASLAGFAPVIAETANATDSTSPQYRANPAVDEAVTGTDAASAAATFTPRVAETATATDETLTGNNTFNPSLTETGTATDSPAANWTTSSAVSETASATDTTRSAVIFVGAIAEAGTASDLTSALATFVGRIAETGNLTDVTLVAPSVFNPQVSEAVAALDTPSTIGTFNVQFVDSATAVDAVIGAYLWNLIDDAQNPDWGAINTAQNPAWAVADTAQPAGWTVIQNPQTPGWSTIDDSQTPGWQNTDTLN